MHTYAELNTNFKIESCNSSFTHQAIISTIQSDDHVVHEPRVTTFYHENCIVTIYVVS